MKYGSVRYKALLKALVLGVVDVWAAVKLYAYAWPLRNVLVRIWFNYAVPVSYMGAPAVPDAILYRYGLVALSGALLLYLLRLHRIEGFRVTRMVFLPPSVLLLQWGGLLVYHAIRTELNIYVFSGLLVFWALFSMFAVLWRCVAWGAARGMRKAFPVLLEGMERWATHWRGEAREAVPSTLSERFDLVMARSQSLISEIQEQKERIASIEGKLKRLEAFREKNEETGKQSPNLMGDGNGVSPAPLLPCSRSVGTEDGWWTRVVGAFFERMFQRWSAVRASRRASLDGRSGILRRRLRRDMGGAIRVLEEWKRGLRGQVSQIRKLRRELRRSIGEWEEERAIAGLAEQLGERLGDGNRAAMLEEQISASSERMRALRGVLDAHYGMLGVPAPWSGRTYLSRFRLRFRSLIASFKARVVYAALNRLRLPYRMVRYFQNDPAAIFIVTFMVLLMACAFLLMIPSFVGTYIPRGISVDIVRATFEKLAEHVANVAYFALVIGVLMRLVEYLREQRSVKRETGSEPRNTRKPRKNIPISS